jgi:hypothetical protein
MATTSSSSICVSGSASLDGECVEDYAYVYEHGGRDKRDERIGGGTISNKPCTFLDASLLRGLGCYHASCHARPCLHIHVYWYRLLRIQPLEKKLIKKHGSTSSMSWSCCGVWEIRSRH